MMYPSECALAHGSMEVTTMQTYETHPDGPGPETARTIRAIENEARAKLGLDPLPEPQDRYGHEIARTDALMDLRKKWALRDDR